MNIRKSIAIVAAVAINLLALASFHAWSVGAMASAASASQPDPASVLITLPTITVRPTAAQMRALRHGVRPKQASVVAATVTGGMQALVMPYYSFADRTHAAREG